ncbi:hypothetical protein RRG08_043408 [Elysia crispata]|uniref:Uncharacterized protein n=1 Tax=Elysia crispata TaxID=231223 RepID=A0AAE1ATJ5_9GAST|nr:hypothetical protein RRG08_043408 [Elysia crispata]
MCSPSDSLLSLIPRTDLGPVQDRSKIHPRPIYKRPMSVTHLGPFQGAVQDRSRTMWRTAGPSQTKDKPLYSLPSHSRLMPTLLIDSPRLESPVI